MRTHGKDPKSACLKQSMQEVLAKGWCYQYRVGTRVLGTSAHVASVLWYLGCASYQGIVR
jgi:hypothetical protein